MEFTLPIIFSFTLSFSFSKIKRWFSLFQFFIYLDF
jgi:hypothetical protein